MSKSIPSHCHISPQSHYYFSSHLTLTKRFLTPSNRFAKTRAQLRTIPGEISPRNPFAVVSLVYKNEGLRALYKGCGALVIGSVGKDAVRFLSFDTVKNAFRDPETGVLTPWRNMFAGMAAGVVASVTAVTPTERIKTALIDDARTSRRYESSGHCIRMIVKEDGWKGLYRGLVGTTLKQASATSFRMGSYNIIKDYEEVRGIQQSTAVNFGNGAVAGVVTVCLFLGFESDSGWGEGWLADLGG